MFHTTTGNQLCREPDVALQMLYLTMQRQSSGLGTRAMDIVDEHDLDSYKVGAAAHVAQCVPSSWDFCLCA